MTTEERCAEIEGKLRTSLHSFDHARDLTWAIAEIRTLTEELEKTRGDRDVDRIRAELDAMWFDA
jgi:hypothetical protein